MNSVLSSLTQTTKFCSKLDNFNILQSACSSFDYTFIFYFCTNQKKSNSSMIKQQVKTILKKVFSTLEGRECIWCVLVAVTAAASEAIPRPQRGKNQAQQLQNISLYQISENRAHLIPNNQLLLSKNDGYSDKRGLKLRLVLFYQNCSVGQKIRVWFRIDLLKCGVY